MTGTNRRKGACFEKLLWDSPETQEVEKRLIRLGRKVCRGYTVTRNTACEISFYPYTSLKSTVKIENHRTVMRLSDVLQEAPLEVLEALMHVLIAGASRRKPASNYLQRYLEYLYQPEVESRHAEIRLNRAKKQILGARGKYYDLNRCFARLNRRYFGGKLCKPTLTWSVRRSRRQLGYHDDHLNLIVISRWLDRASVPPYVVDYVMYHEMLHMVIPIEYRQGKRVVHTQEFKQKENEFVYFREAMKWLSGG